jgi:2-methylcitrate dehydratase PrpD
MAQVPHPSALDEMARFSAALTLGSLPPDVIAKVKDCVVDALSACLTVGARLEGQCALALVRSRPAAAATVFGTPDRATAADAAFVNAVTAFGTSRSDTHTGTASHPGSVVIPAVLALAEARCLPGVTVIVAIATGYETMLRVGEALITPEFARIFRPTAMMGPTGAAIAASRVLGLDQACLVNAASLATQTACGFNEWSNAGTAELAYHSGTAARNGVDCALLAEAGAVAAPSVLEGPAGLLAGFGALDRADRLLAGLGSDYRLLDITHKPAPACIFVQAPCQVAQRLVRDRRLDGSRITAIEVRVSEAAARYPGCDDPGPILSAQAAKMSIQFAVAAVLLHGAILDHNWSEFSDPAVNALAARTRIVADGAAGPGCRIAVTLDDGRVEVAEQNGMDPMSANDLLERFMQAALPRIGGPAARQVLDLIDGLERVEDVSVLARALAV